jgi:hypothetical protein
MIGPQYRRPAYEPTLERALLYTAPGQADWAVPDSPYACRDCLHWRASGAHGEGRCAEYARRMQGCPGASLRAGQRACRAFLAAEKKR